MQASKFASIEARAGVGKSVPFAGGPAGLRLWLSAAVRFGVNLFPGMLDLPVTSQTRFVLVRPHYPENVGAAARAMKTMGLTRLSLVKPGRLAVPEHVMAQKMAVKSLDVLNGAERRESVAEAVAEADWVVVTTSRSGVGGIQSPKRVAEEAVRVTAQGGRVCILFGNEKTGLTNEELEVGHARLRIPIAAPQPSINLAQAVQVVAYELFAAGLDARAANQESAS